MFTTVGLPKITWAKPVTMRFRHRKCHTFGSKLPWLQIVSAMVLGRNSGTLAAPRLQVYETTRQRVGRWPVGLRRTTDNGQRRAVATCRLVVSWSAKRKRSIMRQPLVDL